MTAVSKWTVMRASGAAEMFPGPKSGATHSYDYLGMLDYLGRDMMSGGSNYDRPIMLFADGKPVKIEGYLTDIAYSYVTEKRVAYERSLAEVNAKWNKENLYD